jgi:HK97 family phage major capsid protein
MEELKALFEQFKIANDERLKQIEKNGHADPLLENKVDAMNAGISEIESKLQARIDTMEAIINRQGLLGGKPEDKAQAEYKQSFNAFMRHGAEIKAAGTAMTETAADGGYAVPVELDRAIQNLAVNMNVMRALSTVVAIGSPTYQKLVNLHGTASGWVGETAARPATGTPQFAQITPFMGELYANPPVSQQLLDDAFFDVEAWLAGEVAQQFAVAEGTAFTTGDGVTKPKGFLAYTFANTADGVRAFGSLQYVPTGVAADFKATTPADNIFDLVYTLKAAHRVGAVFQMSKLMLANIRKFKTTTNEYLWTPSAVVGEGITGGTPGTLAGYPVYENEDMSAAVGANALVCAFGNFKNGYTIVDRMGTRVLRDPYSNKPYVNFYTTKRVGGMVTDSEAIKVLKCSVA